MANIVRFETSAGARYGLLEGDTIRVVAEPIWDGVKPTGETVAANTVRLLPPCEPKNIVCVGLNYSSHLQGRPIPDPPTLFFKPFSSIAGPDDEVVLPPDAGRVDPEGEIVIVIGKKLKNVSRAEAQAGIFGYTAGNDVSAREWQQKDGQWWRAKGSDTFGIFGPSIVTTVPHDALELVTRVNGDEVQRGHSTELIRDIPEIVRYVASVITLLPGDIIYTGTPGSPQALRSGDVIEVEVTGVGVLRNRVR